VARPPVLLLGPSLAALSGVTTHVRLLLGSRLAQEFALRHFQVGSEGREERAAARLARLAASPLRLAVACLRHGAAIVHINTSLNARGYWRDLAYAAAAKLCGARVVWQVHGGALPEVFSGKFPLLSYFVKATLQLPDAIVVLAESELKAYREFVPGQTVLAIPNGIDCAPFRAAPRRAASDGARGGPLRALYIGRLAARKGLTEILEALLYLQLKKVPVRLVIAGSGAEEAALKRQAAALGLQKEIVFAGPAYGADKAKLLAESDVLLLPSYSEGLPYALLEAMAAGVVPVVTPVGAIPDVVERRAHGLFVPVRDARAIAEALGALAADRAQLARMSAACRSRIAGAYSIERLASDLIGLYKKLLVKKAPYVRASRLGRPVR
jgi:glycosyltransferase involved in cell wall biosynthesis